MPAAASQRQGTEPTDERIQHVLALAKETPRMLTDADVLAAAGARG